MFLNDLSSNQTFYNGRKKRFQIIHKIIRRLLITLLIQKPGSISDSDLFKIFVWRTLRWEFVLQ